MSTRISHSSARLRYGSEDRVLVGGCFDLLHVGHINLLLEAKSLGGHLTVAVLSDRYVRSYKGPMRPIQRETERLSMVQAIRAVDDAWISDVSPSSLEVIARVKPRSVVFGLEGDPDKDARRSRQAEMLMEEFGDLEVHFVPRHLPRDISTSILLQRLAEFNLDTGLTRWLAMADAAKSFDDASAGVQ